ncbi:hypothetical protein KSS93_18485 [Pseudomonas xanthosomatis]|uniref:hypothetical protein n=1 Tax=Pseudomonas xanthosomatis TaxID=2842356 RepID=UPI001C3DF761|nr:hypothetical protein [Pseudomonas xanthosomatis]QXH44865.1 hypothetical protein KSS93_18485 [Pseudomonas xanthosomatis]
MNSIHDVIKNETPTDVILFITGNNSISHPHLDRLYNRNDWIFVGDCLGLINIIKEMINQGLIEEKGGGYIKGPNWREPEFITLKKYNLNSSS